MLLKSVFADSTGKSYDLLTVSVTPLGSAFVSKYSSFTDSSTRWASTPTSLAVVC